MKNKILISHYGLVSKNGWGRTFEEAKGLVKLAYDVTLICTERRVGLFQTVIKDGVKIIIFSDFLPVKFIASGYGCLSLLFKLFYVFFVKFDIVLANSHRPNSYLPCLVNKKIYSSLMFIEWWDDFEYKAAKILEKKTSKLRGIVKKWFYNIEVRTEISSKINSDGCIVLSDLLYKKAEASGISKVIKIHGGCNVDRIIPSDSLNGKRIMNIPNSSLTFGYIGMGDFEFNDMKYFFEAFSELSDEFEIKFINFGRPFTNTCERYPNYKKFIIEGGWIDYYSDSTKLSSVDIFVLIKEDNIENNSGWPTKFGDFLAAGRPVLMNEYGELIEFNKRNDVSIFKVDNSKDSIRNTIINILNTNSNIVKMGENNRLIGEKNSWIKKSEELSNFFEYVSK